MPAKACAVQFAFLGGSCWQYRFARQVFCLIRREQRCECDRSIAKSDDETSPNRVHVACHRVDVGAAATLRIRSVAVVGPFDRKCCHFKRRNQFIFGCAARRRTVRLPSTASFPFGLLRRRPNRYRIRTAETRLADKIRSGCLRTGLQAVSVTVRV